MISVRHGAAGILSLFALAGTFPAEARSRTRLVLRVDLATGASKKLYQVSVGWPQPPTEGGHAAAWWRRTAGGHEPELRLDVEDVAKGHVLVVRADERERLRLPLPIAFFPAEALAPLRPDWEALEGDHLVVSFASRNPPELLLGIDLAKRVIAWQRTRVPATGSAARALDGLQGLHAVGDGRVAAWTGRSWMALDAATGTELWSQARDVNDATSSPSLHAVPGGDGGPRWLRSTRHLTMLDARSGQELWRLSLGPGDARWCVVQGRRIYVAWRTQPGRPSEQDVLAAVDLADGRILWRNPPTPLIATGAGVAGDALVTWSADGLARIDTSSGHRQWQLADTGPTTIEPLGNGDWLLPDAGCTRIDSGTGAVRWKLGAPCRRLGEQRLLTVEIVRRGDGATDVTLLQHTFEGQKPLRRDVVHRYRGFTDQAGCEVLENATATARGRATALISCDFIVLD